MQERLRGNCQRERNASTGAATEVTLGSLPRTAPNMAVTTEKERDSKSQVNPAVPQKPHMVGSHSVPIYPESQTVSHASLKPSLASSKEYNYEIRVMFSSEF